MRDALGSGPPGVFQCLANGAGRMPDDDDDEKEEHLPVRTSILYPGGEPINVSVRAGRSGYVVTDKGIATRMVGRYLPIAPDRWASTARKICKGLNVEINNKE